MQSPAKLARCPSPLRALSGLQNRRYAKYPPLGLARVAAAFFSVFVPQPYARHFGRALGPPRPVIQSGASRMAVSPPPSPSLVRSAHLGALLPIRPPEGGSPHTALGLRSPAAWLALARRALRSRREPCQIFWQHLTTLCGMRHARVVHQHIHKVGHRSTG